MDRPQTTGLLDMSSDDIALSPYTTTVSRLAVIASNDTSTEHAAREQDSVSSFACEIVPISLNAMPAAIDCFRDLDAQRSTSLQHLNHGSDQPPTIPIVQSSVCSPPSDTTPQKLDQAEQTPIDRTIRNPDYHTSAEDLGNETELKREFFKKLQRAAKSRRDKRDRSSKESEVLRRNRRHNAE